MSSDVASRLRLRSANRHQLVVPRCRLNTYGRRAFLIAGPTVWNSLPDEVRDPAVLAVLSSFLRQSCLVFTNVTSALEVFKYYALYKSMFYFLTLLKGKRIDKLINSESKGGDCYEVICTEISEPGGE